MKRLVVCFAIGVFFLGASLSASGEPTQGTLYRDTWGVPHIYADTLAEAAYVLGYAQAEDRLEDLYKNIRTATGTMAEAFGPDKAETDYVLKLVKNAEVCQEYWKTGPPHLIAIADRFMQGVQAYVDEHPDKKPEFATDLYGWQCAAIGRTMILQWPLGTIQDDLGKKKEAPPFGSNSFAVAPSRSADGCPILMTDPHLTWEGMAVFYEARMHTKNEDICGYFLVGSPLPALGHNAYVAWACTTGGPDTSDVYMVKLNPHNMFQYDYAGKWLTFDAKAITVNIKGQSPEVKPALYSIYGPVVAEPDEKTGIAYCGATPYLDQASVFEQMFKMIQARNCGEFHEALAMNQLMEQNISFADRDGNIEYVRNGRTPIRPDGYDWSVPVPGGTDASRWLGIHDIKDLVQIANPPQGYFQNCNCSPEVMMKDSPMTPDKYKKYIYNVSWDFQSPRGARLLELLDADPSVTTEEAMAYTLNVFDLLSRSWQYALKTAAAAVGTQRMTEPIFGKMVSDLLEWNGEFVKESKVAQVYMTWRLKCENEIDIAAIAAMKPLATGDQEKLLALLQAAMDEVKQKYGAIDVAWGDIHLVGRGGKYFPCDGADFGGGKGKKNETATVMNVSGREEVKGSGKYVAFNGSGTLMLSFLRKDGIESYSLVAWGQNGDPKSPHYADQAEKLYSPRKMKPTWFKKEDLLKNVESEKVVTIP